MFHTKSPLKGHMVTDYQELSQYVLGNSKSSFCLKCMKCMLDYMIQSFLSKLVYEGNSQLKELWKILRCFRSHFVSLLESFQSIPGNS